MLLAWIALAAFVAAALALDLRGHGGRPMSTRTALGWSLAWTAIGVAFALVVLLVAGRRGRERVPRRLPDREVAVARQPVRVRDPVRVLQGAGRRSA